MSLAKRDRSSFKTCTTRSVRSATSPATISQSAAFEGWISAIFLLFAFTAACRSETAHDVVCDDCPAMINPLYADVYRLLTLYQPVGSPRFIVTVARNVSAVLIDDRPPHRIKPDHNSYGSQANKCRHTGPNSGQTKACGIGDTDARQKSHDHRTNGNSTQESGISRAQQDAIDGEQDAPRDDHADHDPPRNAHGL